LFFSVNFVFTVVKITSKPARSSKLHISVLLCPHDVSLRGILPCTDRRAVCRSNPISVKEIASTGKNAGLAKTQIKKFAT
jgi:hypothetical protein